MMTSQISLGRKEVDCKIYRLFTQLKYCLTSCNELETSSEIFSELLTICENTTDSLNTFEIILTNYLLLLDIDEFHRTIIQHYSIANNQFLGSFYRLIVDRNEILNCSNLYYGLLDQMNSSKRILEFLQNEIDDVTCRMILLILFNILIKHENFSILKLKKYETTLFSSLITFIDKEFQRNQPTDNENLIENILVFFSIISKDLSTIPIFLNIHCPQYCLQWLKYVYLKTKEYHEILKILCHIACREEGFLLIRNFNYSDILFQFDENVLSKTLDYLIDSSLCTQLRFCMNMLSFSVTNSSDLQEVTASNIVRDSFLPIVLKRKSVYDDDDFSLENILIVLMKLFTNDKILEKIFEQSSITILFSSFFQTNHCSHLSILILTNMIWSISFQEKYHNELIDYYQKIEKDYSTINYDAYRSREIFSLRRALDGIHENIYPSKSLTISTNDTILISCSHIDHLSYRKFYEILSKTYKISISNQIDNWKQIVDNLQQANIVLFLISKEFFVNKSCRQEFIYTIDILKKSCISIYLDRNYQPNGWLAERLEHLQCFHIDQIDDLFILIQQSFPMEKSSSSDIKRWFTDQHLLSDLYEFYQFQNRNELLMYAKAILPYPWTQEYERIRKRFELKNRTLSPHEFLKFINALTRLQ